MNENIKMYCELIENANECSKLLILSQIAIDDGNLTLSQKYFLQVKDILNTLVNDTFNEIKELCSSPVLDSDDYDISSLNLASLLNDACHSAGTLVSMENGSSTAYSIGNLEDRGVMFIEPGTEVYEGMIVGECNRDNDLAVNVVKGKQLTNTRAAGSDHTVVLKRPRPITLEYALDYINSDELVEVTPNFIRLRKRILNTEERKKFDARNKKSN